MSKRIFELAEQCRTEYRDGYGGFIEQFDEEKFAELIVRDLVSLMESERDYYVNPVSYESEKYYVKMEAKAEAYEHAAGLIKSHFGVEE